MFDKTLLIEIVNQHGNQVRIENSLQENSISHASSTDVLRVETYERHARGFVRVVPKWMQEIVGNVPTLLCFEHVGINAFENWIAKS